MNTVDHSFVQSDLKNLMNSHVSLERVPTVIARINNYSPPGIKSFDVCIVLKWCDFYNLNHLIRSAGTCLRLLLDFLTIDF